MRPLLWMTLILGVVGSTKIRGTPLRSEFSVNVDVKPGHDAFRNRPSNKDGGIIVSQFAGNKKAEENDIHDRFYGFLIKDTNQPVYDKIAVDVPIPNLMNGQLMDLPVLDPQMSFYSYHYQQPDDYEVTTSSLFDSDDSLSIQFGLNSSQADLSASNYTHNILSETIISSATPVLSLLQHPLLPPKWLIADKKSVYTENVESAPHTNSSIETALRPTIIKNSHVPDLLASDFSENVPLLSDFIFDSSEDDDLEMEYKAVTPLAQLIHNDNDIDNQGDTHLDMFSYQLATAIPQTDQDNNDSSESLDFEFIAPQNHAPPSIVPQLYSREIDSNNYEAMPYHLATAIPRFDISSTPVNVVESTGYKFIRSELPKLSVPKMSTTLPISMRSNSEDNASQEQYHKSIKTLSENARPILPPSTTALYKKVPKIVTRRPPIKPYSVKIPKLLKGRSTKVTVASTIKPTTEIPIIIPHINEEINIEEQKDIDILTSILKEKKEACQEGVTWEAFPCSRHFFECVKGERLPAFCKKKKYIYSRKANKCIPRIEENECVKITVKEAKSMTALPTLSVTNKNVSDSRLLNTTAIKSSCENRADGFYRHQANCSRIIQCFGGEEFEYPPCPNNLAFDETTGLCNYHEKVKGCSVMNITTPLPTIEVKAPLQQNNSSIFSEIKENIQSANSTAELKTCDHGSHSPNPSDCSSFYRCVWNQHVLMNCPSGTVFNPKLTVCDYPRNVPQCNRTKTP